MKGGTLRLAAAQVTRAGLDFTRGKGHATARARLTPEEKAALLETYDSDLIDKSRSHDLAGIEAHGTAYKNNKVRVMAVLSFMFHRAERMNREVTFLAGYRIACRIGSRGGSGPLGHVVVRPRDEDRGPPLRRRRQGGRRV